MKNILLLLLLFTGIVNAQIVNIPDANFKAKLLAADTTNTIAYDADFNEVKIDTNNDGQIQVSEALLIERLNVSASFIIDITGIEAFVNLTHLNFSQNQISSVNLASFNQFIQLTELRFNINQITTLLNVNQLVSTSLTIVDFSDNQLTTLDISGLILTEFIVVNNNLSTMISTNAQIMRLYCSFNDLTSVDVLGARFGELHLNNNLLTSIDLSSTEIQNTLNLYGNRLTSLNLSNTLFGGTLYCGNNLFTSLDLSNAYGLSFLSCDENPLLTFLNIKTGNPILTGLFLPNSPTLEYICVDENRINEIAALVSPATQVGSYCSFTPGGNYNRITGNVKFDSNNNGCDAGDINLNNIRVNINDGTNSGASFLNTAGNYSFYTQAGNFQIAPAVENPIWFNFSPTTATIPLADNNNNTVTQDFCISPNGFHPDVEVVISPVFFARPGFDATYQITYRNKGNQTFSGSVNLIFDDSKTDFVSANPLVDNLAVNSLSWNYSNLLPFESRTIMVTLNVNSPTETPAVNIGDTLSFEVSTFPLEADENPQDNTFQYFQTVVGSYDPNDITCLEGDVVAPSEIGNYLHYAINFENTGTFPAENVVVKTEVDAAKFDIGSLQLMNTNFPVDARISGNKVEFIFKNIQLPIGGHGHILLKIKTNATLILGDAVANRADIFFDYNFPIDTGLANTVFQTLSNTDFEIDDSVLVAPNPASNEVIVKAENVIKSIQLYDAQGRIITTSLTNTLESKLDVSSYGNGIYFLKIITEKGMQVQKLQKD